MISAWASIVGVSIYMYVELLELSADKTIKYKSFLKITGQRPGEYYKIMHVLDKIMHILHTFYFYTILHKIVYD